MKIWANLGKNEFSEKGRLEGTMGKFCDFISEKGCLEGTSEIFEKNKVQREKWPVPSNGPPCRSFQMTHLLTFINNDFFNT